MGSPVRSPGETFRVAAFAALRARQEVFCRSGQGHSSCDWDGSARSTRIRAGSIQGASQERGKKVSAPRTPSSCAAPELDAPGNSWPSCDFQYAPAGNVRLPRTLSVLLNLAFRVEVHRLAMTLGQRDRPGQRLAVELRPDQVAAGGEGEKKNGPGDCVRSSSCPPASGCLP